MEGNEISGNRGLKKVPQNCGVMHLCQVGSGACTGMHLRYVQAISFISERQRTDLSMHIGAIFADLPPLPNLGVFHGSECKSSMSLFFTMIIIRLPFRSAYSFRNIQQIDGHLCGSRALAEPPDCIRKLCQKSKLVAGASLAPVRTGGFGECMYSHAC